MHHRYGHERRAMRRRMPECSPGGQGCNARINNLLLMGNQDVGALVAGLPKIGI
jgi:hypothetical protein